MLDSVELEEVAIGEKDGPACLHLDKSNLGGSALVAAQSNGTIPVAVRPLVRYLPDERWTYRMFIIKIDVEGYEDRVLAPFLASIAERDMPDAILMETRHVEHWSIDLVTLLKQRGYTSHFEGEDHNTFFLRTHSFL